MGNIPLAEGGAFDDENLSRRLYLKHHAPHPFLNLLVGRMIGRTKSISDELEN